MVISLKRTILPVFIVIISAAVIILILVINKKYKSDIVLGGTLHNIKYIDNEANTTVKYKSDLYSSRFSRPSDQPELENKYSFSGFIKNDSKHPLITTIFKQPEEVIYAYYGILKNAANMAGYCGGCGSIGDSKEPYQYAYELLSADNRTKISFKGFEDSFKGIGHITFLKLYPAFSPDGTPQNIRYYMVETEIITGPECSKSCGKSIGFFAYYYGLATTVYNKDTGWKIQSIDYLPEDFLCAPMHGWVYDSNYFVEAVYKDWYKLIDKIDSTDKKGNMIYIYASGKSKKYRFDFVRITNGYDILLHENIYSDGAYKETNILKENNQNLKLSILNPNLSNNKNCK